MQHYSDRSGAAMRGRRSVVCEGLDLALERLPQALAEKLGPGPAERAAAAAAGAAAGYQRAAGAAAESMRNDLAFAL